MIRRLRGIAGRLYFGVRRQWAMRRGARACALVYHRVAPDVGDNPYRLCVSTRRLAEQLAWLRAHCDIVPLTELVSPGRGRLRVALTFDDGYADNLHHALPVLERYSAPATVFVTAGQVGTAREFWWDDLERLVLRSPTLPRELRLVHEGREYAWPVTGTSEREAVFWRLYALLKPASPAEQRELLTRIEEAFPGAPPPRTTHRAVTEQEFARLAASRLITIGGHTVNHVCLAARPVEEQQREINEGLAWLRERAGRPVTTFAYPYGGKGDVGPDTPRLVARAGCDLARVNGVGLVRKDTDRFLLPGACVLDWDGDRFGRYLLEGVVEGRWANWAG